MKPEIAATSLRDSPLYVDRPALERTLEKIRAKVKNPKEGLFGPDSMVWKIYPQMILGIGGGKALLLQTAHPFVAHAVEQHSKFRTDPHGRGTRTFTALFAWLYGDLDSAFKAARRVHALHGTLTGQIPNQVGPFAKGSTYEANLQDALFWVHATLWETPIQAYELVVGKLSAKEKEQYYQESKLFAYLFGVEDAIIPPTWNDFLEYCEQMYESEILTVDSVSLEIADFVLRPPKPSLQGVVDWYKIITAGLMHERIRHQYRFKYGWLEEKIFENSIRAMRAIWPRLPYDLQYAPIYRRAMRRLGRQGPPSPLAKWVEKAMLMPGEKPGEKTA